MTSVPINFVVSCTDTDLALFHKLDPESNTPSVLHTSRGDVAWCLRAYLYLKKRGNLNVYCSNKLEEKAINIVYSDHLPTLKGTSAHFIVCVQADFPQRPWAQYHIVHNQNLLSSNRTFIPFWVQPGLIRRDPNRKEIQRVAYSGQIWNGNLAGEKKDWIDLFAAKGLEFVTISEGAWHDLSAVDVLIGIRSFDKRTYDNKPATKLVNAWHAQIPFIGGNDSAFRQLGTPGADYLVATSPKEVLDAVVELRDNPELYKKLISNGVKKTQLYNNETISKMWEATLSGPILKRYHKWNNNQIREWIRFNLLLQVGMSEHKSKQMIKHLTRNTSKLFGIFTKLYPQ